MENIHRKKCEHPQPKSTKDAPLVPEVQKNINSSKNNK